MFHERFRVGAQSLRYDCCNATGNFLSYGFCRRQKAPVLPCVLGLLQHAARHGDASSYSTRCWRSLDGRFRLKFACHQTASQPTLKRCDQKTLAASTAQPGAQHWDNHHYYCPLLDAAFAGALVCDSSGAALLPTSVRDSTSHSTRLPPPLCLACLFYRT